MFLAVSVILSSIYLIPHFFMFSFLTTIVAGVSKYYLHSSLHQTTVVTRPKMQIKKHMSEIHFSNYFDNSTSMY